MRRESLLYFLTIESFLRTPTSSVLTHPVRILSGGGAFGFARPSMLVLVL